MEDVARYADRLIVMNHGEKMFDDTPRNVFRHYKELEAIGLAAPQVTYIVQALRKEGIPIDDSLITVKEARDCLLYTSAPAVRLQSVHFRHADWK